MIQVVTATFEDGVLKPDERLDLPISAKVRLTVESLPTDAERVRQQAWQAVERIWRQSSIDSEGEHLSREQLHERR